MKVSGPKNVKKQVKQKKQLKTSKNYIIEAEVCPDYIHMLVSIPPKISVSGFVEFWKGKVRWSSMRDMQTWNTNMGTDNFGAEDIMLIQQEKMQRK